MPSHDNMILQQQDEAAVATFEALRRYRGRPR